MKIVNREIQAHLSTRIQNRQKFSSYALILCDHSLTFMRSVGKPEEKINCFFHSRFASVQMIQSENIINYCIRRWPGEVANRRQRDVRPRDIQQPWAESEGLHYEMTLKAE